MATTTSGKLEIRSEGEGEVVCLHLYGVVDERYDAKVLLDAMAPVSVLDLEGITRITSFGVRQWSEAMKTLPPQLKHLYLVRCPPSFVDQLNMVLNFGGRSEVLSTNVIYFCEECQEEREVRVDVLANRAQIVNGQVPAAICPTCKKPLVLDEDPQQYFRFAKTYGAKSLEPAAAELLRKIGVYEQRHVERPPEELKLIHGDVTLFCLAGTLDSRFRARRLASGVEGYVVFDLRDVEGLDAEGASRWQKLLEELTAAKLIAVVDLPEVLLGPAAAGMFSLKRTVVHSVCARYHCPACKNEMRESLTEARFNEDRIEACSRCGKPAPLATDRAVLRRLFQLNAASKIPPAVIKTIVERAELISRARAESGSVQRSSGEGLSRYRVVRPLSQGGMAEILLALHRGIGGFEKLIALKKIRKELLKRRHIAVELFLNEAKIAANLNHPNIVQVFEVGEHGGELFIAMEYVHGVDLRELLRQGDVVGKWLSVEQVMFIGSQVAGALHYAHNARDLTGRQLNIVHRDVSLSNVVVGHDGQVKLLDFGIATASVVTKEQDGLVGKLAYMSPEQISNAPLDGRSDLFALGIVIHEMLSRRPLFRRGTDRETLEAVLSAPIPSLAPEGVPPAVEQIVTRAVSRQKENRFPDARAMELAITEWLQQQRSSVDAHQLSAYMRELFGDKAARPPLESTLPQPTALPGSEGLKPSPPIPTAWTGEAAYERTVIDTSPPTGVGYAQPTGVGRAAPTGVGFAAPTDVEHEPTAVVRAAPTGVGQEPTALGRPVGPPGPLIPPAPVPPPQPPKAADFSSENSARKTVEERPPQAVGSWWIWALIAVFATGLLFLVLAYRR
jgi:serine/threonine protein kinase